MDILYGIWMLAGGKPLRPTMAATCSPIGCAFMYAVQVILVGRFCSAERYGR